tara:strand:+ start:285 stop:1319 length:1035 start_codon:yes stop_codon:yes gene_type:complete
MKQTNLLSFLSKDEKNYLIPNNFIMDWNKNQPGKCQFLYDNEFDKKDYMKLGSFTWRDFSQEISIYYKNDEAQPKLFKTRSKNYSTTNISLLKSALQKAVRRQNVDLAVNIALQLINLDFIEFIRRLAIIIIEDVSLNYDYISIIWFMCASATKNLILTKNNIKWILGYVAAITKNNYKFKYQKKDNIDNVKFINNDIFKTHNDILLSLFLRKSYGGMDGDKRMLNFYLDYYYNKFKKMTLCDNFNELNLIVETLSTKMEIIDVLDFPLEAVDFHCDFRLLKNIKKNFDEFSEEDVKLSIWYCSSGINFRQKEIYDKKYDYIWKNIKYLKYELSKKYLIYSKKK